MPLHECDIEVCHSIHLSAAARAFWANKWILCDKQVPVALRIKYFEAVFTPVAGHRKIYQHQPQNYATITAYFAGSPARTGLEHAMASDFAQLEPTCSRSPGKISNWSETCCRQYWKFASYVASLPSRIWVRHVMECFPAGTRVGRPRNNWCTELEAFARVMGWENWTAYARHSQGWQRICDAFVSLATQ